MHGILADRDRPAPISTRKQQQQQHGREAQAGCGAATASISCTHVTASCCRSTITTSTATTTTTLLLVVSRQQHGAPTAESVAEKHVRVHYNSPVRNVRRRAVVIVVLLARRGYFANDTLLANINNGHRYRHGIQTVFSKHQRKIIIMCSSKTRARENQHTLRLTAVFW